MSAGFEGRLNKILDRLLSKELLSNAGLGNEIGFYIFDYPPEEELKVRAYLETVKDQIAKRQPDLRFIHLNWFDLIIEHLRERNLLERGFKLQRDKGDAELLKALKGPLHEQKIAKVFIQSAQPENNDLILLSGVGNAWPLLRSHTLLNNLHPLMQDTPLVVFYPGTYDGQGLRLFGRLKDNNYYRAFRLVP